MTRIIYKERKEWEAFKKEDTYVEKINLIPEFVLEVGQNVHHISLS